MSPRIAVLAAALIACPTAIAGVPPSVRENQRPGTPEFFNYIGDGTAYQVYASSTSVAPGRLLKLHVSAPPASTYRVEIFRIGYYGGVDARRVACTPSCDAGRPGIPQAAAPPPDPSTGEVAAGWPVTDVVRVGRRWASGYYVARVVSLQPSESATAVITFIVREPPRRRARVLVVAPVNTWQAYNAWGGKSLYAFNSGGAPANRVSFDRPVGRDAFGYEIQLVAWLESHPWDVAYATDVDVDRSPGSLLGRRLVMTAGHGEYWTSTERDAFDRARDSGVNLAFMGSNTGYWQVRYEDHRRTIVGYKSADDPVKDPRLETIRFRDLRRPECQLEGVQFMDGAHDAGSLAGDYTAMPGIAPWAGGTGLAPGDAVPQIVGYEWDSVVPECRVPRPTVLFSWGSSPPAQAVTYVARSGARVFASGSLEFAWGLFGGPNLTSDPRLRAFMTNYVEALLEPSRSRASRS